MTCSQNNDEIPSPPPHDRLGVLTSTQLVVEQGESVWINHDQIEHFCQLWIHQKERFSHLQTTTEDAWNTAYHFFDDSERTVHFLLVLDALNFCFWAEKGQTRWTIDYQGQTLNGYWAEAAALKRSVEDDGLPLWDAHYLQNIDEKTVRNIFRGTATIPLLAQRVDHMQEVGNILQERYQGHFMHALEEAHFDATSIALLLSTHFPSFHDVSTYRNHAISFLKRAQIYVADLYGAFAGEKWGKITGLQELSIFADYKLPQVLRYYNILEYTSILSQRVDNQELIAAGSEEEIEIRANTIWACELIRQIMEREGIILTAIDIDHMLWQLGQTSNEMKPYHRTRTIYY